MRTTVTLPDPLLVRLKQVAAERHTSVTKLVVESVDRYLAEYRSRDADASLPTIPRARPVPGVDLNDTSALLDID